MPRPTRRFCSPLAVTTRCKGPCIHLTLMMQSTPGINNNVCKLCSCKGPFIISRLQLLWRWQPFLKACPQLSPLASLWEPARWPKGMRSCAGMPQQPPVLSVHTPTCIHPELSSCLCNSGCRRRVAEGSVHQLLHISQHLHIGRSCSRHSSSLCTLRIIDESGQLCLPEQH